MAVTNPDAEPHLRASQIIVPARHARLRARAQHLGHGRRRRRLRLATPRCAITTCACPVRTSSATRARASSSRRSASGPGASITACAGLASASAPSSSCARAPPQRELAPGKPLGTKQIVQAWIAESRAEIDAARLMVLHAAWKIDDEGLLRGARADLPHQVLRRRRARHGARPRHPGARRARHHRRHAARRLVSPRARGAHLRRPRRGAQDGRGQAHPEEATACRRDAAPIDPRARCAPAKSSTRARSRSSSAGTRCACRSFRAATRTSPISSRAARHSELVLRRPPFGIEGRRPRTTWGASTASCRSCTRSIRRRRSRSRTCEDAAILGAPFYVMERIVGVILRRDPPAELRAAARRRGGSARRSSTTWSTLHAARLSRRGPRRARQARGLRRAAGARLGGALSKRAHRRYRRYGVSREVAGRAHAATSRARRSSTTTTSTTTSCSRRTI